MARIKKVHTKNKKLNLLCRIAGIWYIALGTMTYFTGMTNAEFTDDATVQFNLQVSEWVVLDDDCEEKTDISCTKEGHSEEVPIEVDQTHKDSESEESENKEETESQNQENTSDISPVEEQIEPSNDKQEGQAEESITEKDVSNEGE